MLPRHFVPRRALLLMLLILGTVSFVVPERVAADPALCQPSYVPVSLGPGLPAQYTIYGELCLPASGTSHTVQVLVPGGSYSHVYWDFPYQSQSYSYVRVLNAAGYSTFNIDRIGIGKSSHPPIGTVTVTMDTNAYVIHQIVQDLRNGSIDNKAFAQVMLVGHSLGSVAAWVEAGTYHDVDGLIITGLLHHLNSATLSGIVASLYPAESDPRFAGNSEYLDYLTTEPGTRGKDFYYLGNVNSNVLATDEATKETATPGEFSSFSPPIADGISTQITVPVLVAVGQQDSIFCGLAATDCSSQSSVQQAEAPYYSSQAQLQVALIPDAGHDLNLQENAPTWFAAAVTWTIQHATP